MSEAERPTRCPACGKAVPAFLKPEEARERLRQHLGQSCPKAPKPVEPPPALATAAAVKAPPAKRTPTKKKRKAAKK